MSDAAETILIVLVTTLAAVGLAWFAAGASFIWEETKKARKGK